MKAHPSKPKEKAMKTLSAKTEFVAAFHDMGRGNQYTHKGLCELYDFLYRIEGYTGEEIKLDVIALCCDFVEDNYVSIAGSMGFDFGHYEDEEDIFQAVLDELNDSAMVVYADEDTGLIMYQVF